MTTDHHQAQVPRAAYDYFFRQHPHIEDLPGHHRPVVIAQVFYLDRGWKRHPLRKRVSYSECRRLRAAGATHVALKFAGRTADFSLQELVRR